MAFNDPHLAPQWQEVAAKIHASGRQIVIAVTGGGSGAISALLQTPGASRTILEAIVPYSYAALAEWIGAQPEQACSAATARAMAMAAFMRARKLAPDAAPETWLGVGATASLATDREKRGSRRIHVAFQSATQTTVGSLMLVDQTPTRARDEEVAQKTILWTIANACDIETDSLRAELPLGGSGEHFTSETRKVGSVSSELLLGPIPMIVLIPFCITGDPRDAGIEPKALLSGAFNPIHVGHRRMAEIAEQMLQKPVAWELSITNVDKLPLDFIAIDHRANALQAECDGRLIALTRAPTFREKSELFPGAIFVVGADTLLRIADLKYYGGDPAKRDAAVAEIAARGCRFLAFGRVLDGRFTVLSDLTLPPALAAICDEVPASEFREDISSTQLRSPPSPQ